MILATWFAKSIVREIERNRSIQHGNGYLAEGVVFNLPHVVYAAASHTYVLSKLAGNNTL